MSQFTVYVSALEDAAAYYESLFGFAHPNKEVAGEQLLLSSTNAQNKETYLSLVANEQAAYVQTHEQNGPNITWVSHQFWEDYHAFSSYGVLFEALPKEHDKHPEVTFLDAYGIRWTLKG